MLRAALLFELAVHLAQAARVKSKEVVVSGDACADVWNALACADGQFDQGGSCYTCGSRIEWQMSQGMSEDDAKRQVGEEFFGTCGACCPNPEDYQIQYDGYREVWRDDFNGNGSPDWSKWSAVNAGGGFGNNELQYYTPRETNVWVSDGTLKIRAQAEEYNGAWYTSAKLESKADWKYGKMTIRAKMSSGRGSWAAIWMFPRDSAYGIWPKSGEIDIMEHVGYEAGVVHGTVHTQAYHHTIGTQLGGQTDVDDIDKFHDYIVEWRDDLMLFAVDGQTYQVFSKRDNSYEKWPFNKNFYMILNMAVGGDWGGQQGIDQNAFKNPGQILEVAWAKVEQRRR